MKIISTEFLVGAVSAKQYPKEDLPEFAFVGRSNVGKSSLIKSLLNRKNWYASALLLARHVKLIFSILMKR